MLTTYTLNQMVSLWRQRAGHLPVRTDCSIEAEDGVDIDAIIQGKIRQWQLELLDTADPALLEVSEIAELCAVERDTVRASFIALPAECRRVISVQMASWPYPVKPLTPEQASRRQLLSGNPYAAPGPVEPLVTAYPGRLVIAPGEARIISLKAITDPGPETITIDERLLSKIPSRLTLNT